MLYNTYEVIVLKKAYSLDYSIIRDTDRVKAVTSILDSLPADPNEHDLEQMGSYILYGKDENGLNAVQRGEITDNNKRYSSYKKKDDLLISLEETMENPTFKQQNLQPAYQRSVYTHPRPCIKRPKYAKDGTLIDIGDGDIPGMKELWASIDRIERWILALEGKADPLPNHIIFEDDYRLYQLKHSLIDLRRHQYYLKDSYKPTLYFPGVDHPRQQFIDWTSDSAYWISLKEWQHRIDTALLPIEKDLSKWETRKNFFTAEIEVKWVVQKHTFNWENPVHIRALLRWYDDVYEQFREKIDTYGRTLIFDFDRYCAMANLTPIRKKIVELKIKHYTLAQINEELIRLFNVKYNENHLSAILLKEVPEQIAQVARRYHLLIDTPKNQRKCCCKCGKNLPLHPLFYAHNRGRKDGFSSVCKDCDRKRRIEVGGQPINDNRYKDSQMLKV